MQANRSYLLRFFTLPYGLGLGIGIVFLVVISLVMGYYKSFLFLNGMHHPWLDVIMPHFTHLGQGVFAVGLIAFLLARRDPAWALACMVSTLLLVPLVGILKAEIFYDLHRPLKALQGETIHYIALRRVTHFSFPSGHSAAAGASLLFAVGLIPRQRRRIGAFLLGVLAVLIGYSRVYIGVHFPADVAAGLTLGALAGLFGVAVIYPWLANTLMGQSGARAENTAKVARLLGLVALALGVIMLANTYYLDSLNAFDTRLFLRLNGWHSPFWDKVMLFLSAKAPWLWVPVALVGVAWWEGGWKRALQMFIGIAVAITLADRISAGLLKPWVARIRPCKPEAGLLDQMHLVKSCGGMYGFVSSHAANFFAVAMLTFLTFPKRWLAFTVFFLAAAVGYSRIYLGVHYPGDVVFGAVLGLGCGYVAWWAGFIWGARLWKK